MIGFVDVSSGSEVDGCAGGHGRPPCGADSKRLYAASFNDPSARRR